MTALESMTSIALVQLRFALLTSRPNELGPTGDSLHRAPPPNALLDLREGGAVRDSRQIPEDQLGHRDPFPGRADLQRPVEVVGHVSYLDHLHVIKGRTRRS